MTQQFPGDCVDLFDVFALLKRQLRFAVSCFFLILLPPVVFVLFQPTIYQATAGVVIGGGDFFSRNDSLIESVDEIEYRYKNIADVSRVGKSNIVNFSVKHKTYEGARQSLESAVSQLVDDHKLLYAKKRDVFLEFLRAAGNAGSLEYIKILDSASSTVSTSRVGLSSVQEIKFGGHMRSVVLVGFILALLFSVAAALLKDALARRDLDCQLV